MEQSKNINTLKTYQSNACPAMSQDREVVGHYRLRRPSRYGWLWPLVTVGRWPFFFATSWRSAFGTRERNTKRSKTEWSRGWNTHSRLQLSLCSQRWSVFVLLRLSLPIGVIKFIFWSLDPRLLYLACTKFGKEARTNWVHSTFLFLYAW